MYTISQKYDYVSCMFAKNTFQPKTQQQMPFIPQNRHLHCIRFFPNLNVPSAQAVPNCASQYLEKPDFDIRSLDPLFSIKMTSRALYSLPRSEETRKTAFPDTNAKVT